MVLDVNAAKQIALVWLQAIKLENSVDFGLPEIDDRYHVWRVPLMSKASKERIGEVVIDARTSLVLQDKSTSAKNLEARLLGRVEDTSLNGTKPDRELSEREVDFCSAREFPCKCTSQQFVGRDTADVSPGRRE